MSMNERQLKILQIISDEQKIEVGRLAEMIDVSQVTIRKDLAAMESHGLIKRQYGYALLNAQYNTQNRLFVHYSEKLDIARRAVELVEDGDNVMLESGSCCALLAEEIVRQRKNVTIITHSVFIANHIRPAANNQVILLGGSMLMEHMVTVGPLTSEAISRFYVNIFFTGTDGITPHGDFTADRLETANVMREMKSRARKTVVLTDSSKFSRQGMVSLFPVKDVYAVYTDSKCPQSVIDMFNENGVLVNIGSKEEE